MHELARDLLEQDNILLGYELEDCEMDRIDGKEVHQFIVRPITDQNFIDLWEHGREYCSKFIIYLLQGKLFCELRPDMVNYEEVDDIMYGEDIIEGAWDIYNNIIEQFGENALDNNINNMNRRIDWALDHLVDVINLGEGSYNILFEV